MNIDNNLIFNTVNNGIIIVNEDLTILAWNKWLEIFTKIKEKEIVNKNLCECFPSIDETKLKRKIKTVHITKNPTFLSFDKNRHLINIPVSNVTNTLYKSMQQDITILPYDLEKKLTCIYIYDNTLMYENIAKLKKINEELLDMSHRDPLTKIFNRRYFTEQSQKIKVFSQRNKNMPISLVILDIDDFKKINDSYGHLLGDEVIIKVARILEAELRSSDIAARFGGEEFVILLQDCEINNALKVAEKIRKDIENTVISIHNNFKIKFTVSAGVAQFDKVIDYDNLEHTLGRADKALYEAKKSGRNRVVLK